MPLPHFSTVCAPRASRYCSATPCGRLLMRLNTSLSWYRSLVLGSRYGAGRPVTSQYLFGYASDGADSMFVYVALGAVAAAVAVAVAAAPLGRSDFSSTSFDRLRDACAKFS